MSTLRTVKSTKTEPIKDVPEGMVTLSVSRTDGKKGKSGLYVMVPAVSSNVPSAVVANDVGAAWMIQKVDEIRSQIISGLHKAGKTITDDKFNFSAILAVMKEETESQRMTKETIGTWFDSDLAPLIASKAKEKMTGITEDKVKKILAGYRETFCELAGRSQHMDPKIKVKLIAAMELLPEEKQEVTIAVKVAEKLESMTEANEMLIAL